MKWDTKSRIVPFSVSEPSFFREMCSVLDSVLRCYIIGRKSDEWVEIEMIYNFAP